MCLISFHWQPNQQLTLSANRDEFYARPTLPLAVWPDSPSIIAGRDLEQGGTWLGLNKQREFAALTNVRTLQTGPTNPPSRGELVSEFLLNPKPLHARLEQLLNQAAYYAPFNLIAGDIQQLWFLTNFPEPRLSEITPGLHVLSNASLDTPWPKTILAKQQLQQWLDNPQGIRALSASLNQREPFAAAELPDTGVGLEMESMLSAQLIQSEFYGTRCSTGLILTTSQAQIAEISWNEQGQYDTYQTLAV